MKFREFKEYLASLNIDENTNVCTNDFGGCNITTYPDGGPLTTANCLVEIPKGPDSDETEFIDCTITSYNIRVDDGFFKVEVSLEPDYTPEWMDDSDMMSYFSFVELGDLVPVPEQVGV